MRDSHERFNDSEAIPFSQPLRRLKAWRERTFLEAEHRARYEWAAKFTRGKTVLDLASGSGYGSYTLAMRGAKQVIGVELESEAVEAARSRYQHPALEYRQDSGVEFAYVSEIFDCIVSFETIEHIDDDRRFLTLLAEHLSPGGTLIISTPNRQISNPGKSLTDRPENPFHVREYTTAEFRSLLAERFEVKQGFIQGQYRKQDTRKNRWLRTLKRLSLVTGIGRGFFAMVRPDDEVTEATYSIFVCTHQS